MTRVVAIDPALSKTGVILAESCRGLKGPKEVTILKMWTISAPKGKGAGVHPDFDTLDRSLLALSELISIIEEHNPSAICVEVPGGSQSAAASKASGAVNCMIASLILRFPDKLFALSKPSQVIASTVTAKARRLLTSDSAKKRLMIDWAEKKYPDAPWVRNPKTGVIQANQNHVADAVGILHTSLGVLKQNEIY